RELATARIIEKDAGQRAAPLLENGDQRALREIGRDQRLGHVGHADSVERRMELQVEFVDDQRALDRDLGLLAALVENPGLDRAAPGQTVADAIVLMQLLG